MDETEVFGGIPGYDPCATANPGDWFDHEAAWRACEFFPRYLVHVKGELAGTPFVLRPDQRAVVANLFGWKRKDGTRRYREVFLYVARKNGKTMLAAGIALYCLFCDGEPGAEIYAAAAERDQAGIVWEIARQMVAASPALSERCRIYQGGKAIVREEVGASFKPISSDANTKHGYNCHCAVVDELHAHRDSSLLDALTTSMGARRQPLLVVITTADSAREGSPCNAKHKYATRVRDGQAVDPAFLPVIYEVPRQADWSDESKWPLANPGLGTSVKIDYLRREHARAVESPAYQNAFRRFHLNQVTEQDEAWLSLARWDLCVGSGDPMKDPALRGKPCWAGFDLSANTDLTAFVMYFPEDGHAVIPVFWIPRATAEKREREDRVPYTAWLRDGLIRGTEGDTVDYRVLRRDVNELRKIFDIREIAIDRWNSTSLQRDLDEDDFEVVPFGQGYVSLSNPSKELEKLTLSGTLRHGGHPVLRWCAGNVAIETDAAGNIKPSKRRSTERIDGVVALVMAIGRAMVRESEGDSVYEKRGVLRVGRR